MLKGWFLVMVKICVIVIFGSGGYPLPFPPSPFPLSPPLFSPFTWDGRRWIQDNSGEIDRRAIDTVKHIYVESGQSEDKNFTKELASYALVCESEARRRAMISSSKALEGIPIRPED